MFHSQPVNAIVSVDIKKVALEYSSKNQQFLFVYLGQKFAMMELRTTVGEIIKNFELKPITKTEDVVIISDLILRAKDPIRVKFVPRS